MDQISLFQQVKSHCPRLLVYTTLVGSHAYGTSTPESDIDVRGIYLPTRAELLGLEQAPETYTVTGPLDLQFYELRHFLRLALKGSPLQLEMIFAPADCALPSGTGKLFDSIKHCFLGKHLRKSLGGFAQSDLHAITEGHTRKCGRKGKLSIERHGYNTRQAANAWRLLVAQHELWTSGELPVRLGTPMDLIYKEIQQGAFTKDVFLEKARELDELCEAQLTRSGLPDGPDFDAVDHWCQRILGGLAIPIQSLTASISRM